MTSGAGRCAGLTWTFTPLSLPPAAASPASSPTPRRHGLKAPSIAIPNHLASVTSTGGQNPPATGKSQLHPATNFRRVANCDGTERNFAVQLPAPLVSWPKLRRRTPSWPATLRTRAHPAGPRLFALFRNVWSCRGESGAHQGSPKCKQTFTA
ncbi:hypothetical protein P154DRAFT_230185 [Amniculicola lignicola CBS 123094]|uniref:Uncharacterized protein n=1 Tax=Amniculicola lignicola CBS 123094 TaxID=1392246 RepID=A0A6A5WEQ2_9PLEO|nr:hypothetical protein P154DRAFT_230185 [Amniculicola lignicola CBS 123094]